MFFHFHDYYIYVHIHLRGNLSEDTLDYFFLVKDSKFARFLMLPKINKRQHDVPGRLVI